MNVGDLVRRGIRFFHEPIDTLMDGFFLAGVLALRGVDDDRSRRLRVNLAELLAESIASENSQSDDLGHVHCIHPWLEKGREYLRLRRNYFLTLGKGRLKHSLSCKPRQTWSSFRR